jgi:hypothetical protein
MKIHPSERFMQYIKISSTKGYSLYRPNPMVGGSGYRVTVVTPFTCREDSK